MDMCKNFKKKTEFRILYKFIEDLPYFIITFIHDHSFSSNIFVFFIKIS